VVEQYAPGRQGALPRQLNVYCFHGQPAVFAVFDTSAAFEVVNVGRFLHDEADEGLALAGIDVDERDTLLEMCRTLSADTDMVRVDWLVTAQGPRFSELTSYPLGGNVYYRGHPRLTDAQVATVVTGYWQVPARYS
jgi:hypothetical protein